MDSAKHRRLLREHRERKIERKAEAAPKKYAGIYHDHYKSLLFFTFGILLLSLIVIGHTYYKTGDVFYKGVSLSGGITISISTQDLAPVDVGEIEEHLRQQFPENDLQVREISDLGSQQGITIEATTKDNSRESLDALAEAVYAQLDIPDVEARASTEVTGPALGASFFRQTLKAVLIAFVFMGMVVFIYFGETWGQKTITIALSLIEAVLIWYADGWLASILALLTAIALFYMYIRYSIPSTAVILAAFSTICFTIAVVDLMQMRISTAGIAAFLMLIGYSVDTDILLSTRVLKSHAGTVYERIVSTMKTGITMTGTTFTAAMIALIFGQSDVIKEIMTIIAIGIIADIFYTWIQNAGILRIYLEKHGRKSDDA
jgi:preprotein translocase subunit SecF